MKKILVAVVAVAVGFAFNAFAQTGTTEVKTKTEVKGETVKKTTEMKGPSGTAKEQVSTTGTTTTTKQEVKGKKSTVTREVTKTPGTEAGLAKVTTKKGAFENFQIEWSYHQEGQQYVTEYTIKNKQNKALMKELNLTPEQVALITPGTHKVVSTSPFTGEDIRTNIRSAVLDDIKNAAASKPAKAK